MILTQQHIEIQQPTELVYAYISNMEHFANWFPAVVKITSANDLPCDAVGKKYLEIVEVPPAGQAEIVIEVVERQPGQRFVTEGAFQPLLPRMTIELEASSPHSTHLSWMMESRATDAAVAQQMVSVFGPVMAQRAVAGLSALKELLERTPVPTQVS